MNRSITDIVRCRDFDAMSRWISHVFGVKVPPESCPMPSPMCYSGYERCGDTLYAHVKQSVIHMLRPGGGQCQNRIAWNHLHVFFMSIEETPEMFERLRQSADTKRESTARSKISKTNLAEITPINRVASKVVSEK